MAQDLAVLGDRYRLVERIGAGGMAVVWRAHDEILHRPVAVKLLSPQLAAQPGALEQLRAEALAVAKLSHPHITAVHDYGEHVTDDGRAQPYLVMELVDGVPLAQALRAAPQGLDWPQAVRIAAQVASALAAAHARGIVHRDVTPGNIMLTADGVKVLDFGICVLTGTVDSSEELLGTVDYIAPERVAGTDAITPACDVYALGIVLYRCLTGRLPWHADTPTQRLRDHVWLPPQDLPPIDGLPQDIRDLCLSCLAKNPADRPAATDIAALLATSRTLAPREATSDRSDADLTRVLAIAPPTVTGPTYIDAEVAVDGGTEHRTHTHKPAVAVAALLATGLTGVMIAGVPDSSPGPRFEAGNPPSCQVSYDERVNGTTYDATMTVRSNTERPATRWRLVFKIGEGEQVVAHTPAMLSSDDQQVAVTAPAALKSGQPLTVHLSGGRPAPGARPEQFSLDGQACDSTTNVIGQVSPSPRQTSVTESGSDDGGAPRRGRARGRARARAEASGSHGL